MALSSPERLAVRVVYAAPPDDPEPAKYANASALAAPRLWVVDLELAHGSSVGDAVLASGLLRHLAGLTVDGLDLGVFNRRCTPDRLVQDGDRIEIYRPLLIDPKAARHLRVQARRKAEARERQATRAPGADESEGGGT
jgi:putative ubiquitin-RnfH superfamily antitoxin RatB of RatAB toxin-antitoxin module